MKTLRHKKKLHVLSNFFFCHNVFKNLSAAEVSGSVYRMERVNIGFVCRKRVQLYKFLLENMKDEHRFQIQSKVCQEVSQCKQFKHFNTYNKSAADHNWNFRKDESINIELSWKHYDKWRNCSSQCFSKAVCCSICLKIRWKQG